MKVLVICDDIWHPGEVIVRGLKPLEKKGYELDFVMAAKDILTKDMLYDYDVILNSKTNSHSPGNASAPWFEPGVTAVMPEDFREYVEAGHGFIALHSGTCYSNKRQAAMTDMIGCEFLGHPPQCTIRAEMVKESPINAGVENFEFRDEHYRINVLCEDADVFMTTTSDTEAGTQVGGYTRLMGKGRLCVLTPGHNCAVLRNEQYAKMLCNALDWCAGNE